MNEVLFRPLQLGGQRLKNRIVMAPMTRYFSPGGVPGENVADYYRRRAEGGVGLIISEGVGIDRPAARNNPAIPNFHGEDALAGWKRVADAVSAAGGAMAPQLWHVGAVRDPSSDWQPPGAIDSPSGIQHPDAAVGQPLTEEGIADIVAAYARAAADTRRLGFAALELHAAHGYLIDQFFWNAANARTDRYGGAGIGERTRFAVEVVRAVRMAVGPDFPVILRISQWKQQEYTVRNAHSPGELAQWLDPLAAAGVDAFHCSQRRFWEPEFPEIDGENGLNLAGWAKKLTGRIAISVGSVGLEGDFVSSLVDGRNAPTASIAGLVERMERDEFDLIAVGRALLGDPDWAEKIAQGRLGELRPYDNAALAQLI